jgi:uncharacterized protein (DUF302 family)
MNAEEKSGMEQKVDQAVARGVRRWTAVVAAFVVGMLVSAGVMWMVMPSLMIEVSEAKGGFDETVAALEAAIAERGWVVAGVRDMNKSLAKQGVEFSPRVKLVDLCKAEYAASVLRTDRQIATMMPCTFAVFEGDDGKVYVSKMNMGLMAKMFGGNVAEVMGGAVVADEKAILKGILN